MNILKQIKYISGNLFEGIYKDTDPKPIVVAHCCNDKGGFGAGFVVPLAGKFPVVKERYLNWHREGFENDLKFELGKTQIVKVDDPLQIYVAQMVAQTLGGLRPLYYNHLSRCMDTVGDFAIETNAKIACPMFGAALSGGSWDVVQILIEDSWIRRGIDVNVYYLPDSLPPGVHLDELQ